MFNVLFTALELFMPTDGCNATAGKFVVDVTVVFPSICNDPDDDVNSIL